MKCSFLLATCFLLAVPPTSALEQKSSYDPASKQQSQTREGFVDFALKQLNPQNTDYGCQLDKARKLTVDETVKSIDSWTVLVALVLLVLSFFLLLHQHRERSRRDVIAAQFLAQYHNAWADARTHAADAIRRYNELVHTKNKTTEDVHRSSSSETEVAQAMPAKADVGRGSKTPLPPLAAARGDITAGEHGAYRSDGACRDREPEGDLVAQVSTLQQQLSASHEREKNLQKELTKAQRRATASQPRDASLQG